MEILGKTLARGVRRLDAALTCVLRIIYAKSKTSLDRGYYPRSLVDG